MKKSRFFAINRFVVLIAGFTFGTVAWALFGAGDIVFDPTNAAHTAATVTEVGKVFSEAKSTVELLNKAQDLGTGLRGIAHILTDTQSLSVYAGLPDKYQDFTADLSKVASFADLAGSTAQTLYQLDYMARSGRHLTGYQLEAYTRQLQAAVTAVSSTLSAYNNVANQSTTWIKLNREIQNQATDPLAAQQMISRVGVQQGLQITDLQKIILSQQVREAQDRAAGIADDGKLSDTFTAIPPSLTVADIH